MSDLWTSIELEYKKIVKNIMDDCVKIFKEAINDAVYSAYSPSWYTRTNQLIECVTGEFKDNSIYIYIDGDKLSYNSWVNYQNTGKEVGQIVPYLVENGHMDDSGVENQYHDFEPRYYLERAKSYIIQKYGMNLEVEIINEKPQWI